MRELSISFTQQQTSVS